MKLLKVILILLFVAVGPARAITIADAGWNYELTIPTLAERVLALEKSLAVMELNYKEALKLAREQMENRMDGFPAQFAMKGDIKGDLETVKLEIENIKKDVIKIGNCQAQITERASYNSVLITMGISILGLFMAGTALILRAYKV